MPHVVAINGSSRNVTTHNLLEEIAARLAPHGVDVTIIDLAGQRIDDCIGCERCIRKTSRCWQDDDAQPILEQLLAADGVILASPVYMLNITGKLKSLIDKTCSWFHRPPMVAKPALIVGTTAGSGLGKVTGYLREVAIQWGMQPAGIIKRSASNTDAVSEAELAAFLWHLGADPGRWRPALRQLIQFQVQKTLALKLSRIDRAYWTERGWQRGYYYYPCRAAWPNRLLAGLVGRILDWRIQISEPF